MKKWILILWCLIFLMPKAEWEALGPEGQAALKMALSQIYFEKHPGTEKARITGSETKGGMIRIEIDAPKQEV